MRKYQGEVIHQSHDPLGVIEVVEDSLSRSLHFGTDARQSNMLLRDPYYLSLSYTRAMCAALLLCEEPQRILLLGLGGGSLAKFLLHHFPQCHIDAVEFRPEVHRVAQQHFALPEDPRLRVFYDDAGQFVRQHIAEEGGYDLMMTDAFLDHGIAYSVCGISFFEACRDQLSPEGVLSMNLWSDDRVHANDFIEDMGLSFEQQVLRLPVEGKANVIGIATRQAAAKKQLRHLDDRAKRLEQRTAIEFTSLLRTLRKLNHRFF
jgi:spermidine synthase